MNLKELNLVIPTEDMRYILNNCNAQEFVLLQMLWVKWCEMITKNNKNSSCITG